MKNRSLTVIMMLLAMTAAVTGCSKEGDVTIVNDASTTFCGKLEGRTICLFPGDDVSEKIYIGKALAMIGPDEFEVTLSGSAWTKKAFSATIMAKEGENTRYVIEDDAAAVYLENASTSRIDSVKIKKCSDPDSLLGPNVLKEFQTLKISQGILFQLDSGCWDFYIHYLERVGSDFISKKDSIVGLSIDIGGVEIMNWSPNTLFVYGADYADKIIRNRNIQPVPLY